MTTKLTIPALRKLCRTILDPKDFPHDCHRASITLVQSGKLPAGARVARGWHKDVPGQHSWVTLGPCHEPHVQIVDPTIWSYLNTRPEFAIAQYAPTSGHGITAGYTAHGEGHIGPVEALEPFWTVGKPIYLKDFQKLSHAAKNFLYHVGSKGLDLKGWHAITKLPVRGWPAGEIIRAMVLDPQLAALPGIDLVGMLTDLNPGALYLHGPAHADLSKSRKLSAAKLRKRAA